MDHCPSCGEVLELVEEAGLRGVAYDKGGVRPGTSEQPAGTKPTMVCSACSWPVDETHP
jgi:hypothetical protein